MKFITDHIGAVVVACVVLSVVAVAYAYSAKSQLSELEAKRAKAIEEYKAKKAENEAAKNTAEESQNQNQE